MFYLSKLLHGNLGLRSIWFQSHEMQAIVALRETLLGHVRLSRHTLPNHWHAFQGGHLPELCLEGTY